MNAEAYLHIVLDPYRGEIVSALGRLEVLSAERHGDDGKVGDGASDAPAAPRLVTVRVASEPGLLGPEALEPLAADAWHLRFVGRRRALDARTSDGSLKSLAWDDAGFTATVDPGDALTALGIRPEAAAAYVRHVLAMPEAAEE